MGEEVECVGEGFRGWLCFAVLSISKEHFLSTAKRYKKRRLTAQTKEIKGTTFQHGSNLYLLRPRPLLLSPLLLPQLCQGAS